MSSRKALLATAGLALGAATVVGTHDFLIYQAMKENEKRQLSVQNEYNYINGLMGYTGGDIWAQHESLERLETQKQGLRNETIILKYLLR